MSHSLVSLVRSGKYAHLIKADYLVVKGHANPMERDYFKDADFDALVERYFEADNKLDLWKELAEEMGCYHTTALRNVMPHVRMDSRYKRAQSAKKLRKMGLIK